MFNTNAQCYQNISQVLLTSAFILWPTCTRGFGIRVKIRCGLRFFGVFLCGFAVFRPPLRPPPGGTITKTLFVCSLFQCVCSNKTYGTNTEMTCSAASNEPLSDAASYMLSWSDSHTPNWLTEVLSLYMRIYTGDNKKHRRPFTSDMPVKSN